MPPASPWRSPRLRPLLAYEALFSFGLWAPVWATWLLSHGLGLAQVALLDGTFRVGTLLFGVPIGLLADRLGARRVLIAAALSYSVALAVMAAAPRFELLVAGWLLWSASSAAYFAAVTPYLFACAGGAAPDGATSFRAAAAQSSLVILASTAAASLAGGWLYAARPWLPFAGDVIIGLLAAAVLARAGLRDRATVEATGRAVASSTGFAESPASPDSGDPRALLDLLHARRRARLVEDLARWPVLRLLLLRAVGVLLVWGHCVFYQPALAALGLTVRQSAAVYAIVQVAGALGAHLAGRRAHLPLRGSLDGNDPVIPWLALLFVLHLPLSLSVLGAPAWLVLPSLAAAWCWFHYRDAALQWRVSAQISDGNRAAVAALESTAAALLLLGSDGAAGLLADRFGARYAPLAVAAIALAVTAVTLAAAAAGSRAGSGAARPRC